MVAVAVGEKTLNDFLKGEISAVETYVQALEKFQQEGREVLEQLKAEHIEACNLLRGLIRGKQERPEQSSGAWGAWAKFVEGTVRAFGKAAALKAPKRAIAIGLSKARRSGAKVPSRSR